MQNHLLEWLRKGKFDLLYFSTKFIITWVSKYLIYCKVTNITQKYNKFWFMNFRMNRQLLRIDNFHVFRNPHPCAYFESISSSSFQNHSHRDSNMKNFSDKLDLFFQPIPVLSQSIVEKNKFQHSHLVHFQVVDLWTMIQGLHWPSLFYYLNHTTLF